MANDQVLREDVQDMRAEADKLRRTFDSWRNVLQGFGVQNRDPVTGDCVVPFSPIHDPELEDAYRGNALAARVVDALPEYGMRRGWQLHTEGLDAEETSTVADGVLRYFDRIGGHEAFMDACSIGRLKGGAIAVIGVDDGADGLEGLKEPVAEDSIKGVRWLMPFGRDEVQRGELETDVSSPNFGKPRNYEIANFVGDEHGVIVDASRVLVFRGAPRRISRAGSNMGRSQSRVASDLDGWDDSVLQRPWQPISSFDIAFRSAALAVRDSSRVRYGMKNLQGTLARGAKTSLRDRMQQQEMCMSILNAMVYDLDGEKIEFMARPLAGIGDILDRVAQVLAAATQMPLTLLLGLSPGGLGTGEDEDKRWNDVVAAWQRHQATPALEKLVKYFLLAEDGPSAGGEPDTWSIKFPAPRVLTDNEKADIRLKLVTAYAKAIEWDVLTPEEVSEGLFGGAEFGLDVQLDREMRAEMEKLEKEAAEAAAKAPPVPPPPAPPVPPTGEPPPPEPGTTGGAQ